jgi:hypothetical protein
MGYEERLITDWRTRERKAVFNFPNSRETVGRTSNDKSEETKTAAGLRCGESNRVSLSPGFTSKPRVSVSR